MESRSLLASLIVYAVMLVMWPWICKLRWDGSWWSNGRCKIGRARIGLTCERDELCYLDILVGIWFGLMLLMRILLLSELISVPYSPLFPPVVERVVAVLLHRFRADRCHHQTASSKAVIVNGLWRQRDVSFFPHKISGLGSSYQSRAYLAKPGRWRSPGWPTAFWIYVWEEGASRKEEMEAIR